MNNEIQIKLEDIEIFSKSQIIRLWDVFFLGPFLVAAGAMNKKQHGIIRGGLVASGLLTIIYNGRNYILNEKIKKALREQDI